MIKLRGLGSQLLDGSLFQSGVVLALSFGHIHDLALIAHQLGWKAWLYPPSVDMLMVGGYRHIQNARKAKQPTSGGWWVFLFGTAFSFAANVVDAWLNTHSALGVIVGTYPALASLVATVFLGHARTVEDAPVTAEPKVDTPEEVETADSDTPNNSLVPQFPPLPKQGAHGFVRAVLPRVLARHRPDELTSYKELHRLTNAYLVEIGLQPEKYDPVYRAAKHLKIAIA